MSTTWWPAPVSRPTCYMQFSQNVVFSFILVVSFLALGFYFFFGFELLLMDRVEGRTVREIGLVIRTADRKAALAEILVIVVAFSSIYFSLYGGFGMIGLGLQWHMVRTLGSAFVRQLLTQS